MGLDMYLEARRFLWIFDDGTGRDAAVGKAIRDALPEMGDMRPKHVVAEAMYWRKANAIHAWFVRNCQDGKDECQHTYVERDKLEELRDTINRVLADRGLAGELLPTQSGFFFGGTDYDGWYWKDLERTSKELTRLLEDENLKGWDFYYHSSW